MEFGLLVDHKTVLAFVELSQRPARAGHEVGKATRIPKLVPWLQYLLL